jgi:hypothetical protein
MSGMWDDIRKFVVVEFLWTKKTTAFEEIPVTMPCDLFYSEK